MKSHSLRDCYNEWHQTLRRKCTKNSIQSEMRWVLTLSPPQMHSSQMCSYWLYICDINLWITTVCVRWWLVVTVTCSEWPSISCFYHNLVVLFVLWQVFSPWVTALRWSSVLCTTAVLIHAWIVKRKAVIVSSIIRATDT